MGKNELLKKLFYYTKAIDGLLLVALTGFQYHTGEVRTVGRIGEVLSLEADCRTERECATVGTLIASSIVGSVELHTWFCGKDFHRTSAVRIRYLGSKTQFSLFMLVQHVAVIEALTELDLFVVCVNVLAERFRGAEIKRCTFHLQNLASRNGGSVGRQIEV